MKLQDIFDQLTYGELSMLNLAERVDGAIDETHYPKLLAFVNLGLDALYKRFDLKIGKVDLILLPDTSTYFIESRFVIGNRKSREGIRYLQEDPYTPFIDDVLKIEKVFTKDKVPLFLNQWGNPYSILNKTVTRLEVPVDIANQEVSLPEELKTPYLTLEYRAKHPKLVIPMGYFDPARVNIELPDAYLQALLLFIASRAHSPMGMVGEGQVGAMWFTRYEAECARLEAENLDIDVGGETHRFERGGWI